MTRIEIRTSSRVVFIVRAFTNVYTTSFIYSCTHLADRISPSPSPSTSASSLRPVSISSFGPSSSTDSLKLRSVSSVPYLQQAQEPLTTKDIDELALAEHFPASNDPRRRTYDTYSKPVMEDIKAASIIPSILLEPSPFDANRTEDSESSGLRNRLSSSLSTASMDTASTAPLSQAQSPVSSIPPFSPSKQRPLSLMNTLLMRKLYRQHHHHSLDPTLKYWNALHFISMVWLTICALYTEWQHNGNLDCLARLLHDQDAPITDFVSKASTDFTSDNINALSFTASDCKLCHP